MRLTHWVFGLAVIAVCSVGTVWLLKPSEADRLREQKEALLRENMERQRAIERLTGQRRLAEVLVLDQTQAGNREPPTTTLQFIELDREGRPPVPARTLVLQDEVIFFDALVIKFDPEHVAAGDALRGRSIALFRRVYGEHQKPSEGTPLDASGDVPCVFRIDRETNPFERKLWAGFWDYVSDPNLAAREGVRVAQGEAVYVPMRKGQQWTLTLDNNGGLNIKLCPPLTEPQREAVSSGLH